MKMFKFKDLRINVFCRSMYFYGHCSFTYLWNTHLIQLHDGITVVINALQNLQCRARSAVLFCIPPARPSDIVPICPPIRHTGGSINQTVNDGVAHSRIGTLDQPVAAW